MNRRLRAAVPFLAVGAVGWLADRVRLADPVPASVESGFYAGDVTVHLLGFPTGVRATGAWAGTLLGLRPVYLLELAAVFLAVHAVAAVVAGRAFAVLLPDADPPTRAVYLRLFAVAVGATLLVGPVGALATVEFLLTVFYLPVLVLAVLPVLVVLPAVLVADRVAIRAAWPLARSRLSGRYWTVLVGLAVVGLAADALVCAPVAGGFLGTAGGGYLYALLGAHTYQDADEPAAGGSRPTEK